MRCSRCGAELLQNVGFYSECQRAIDGAFRPAGPDGVYCSDGFCKPNVRGLLLVSLLSADSVD
jgi:hypothetical protein